MVEEGNGKTVLTVVAENGGEMLVKVKIKMLY